MKSRCAMCRFWAVLAFALACVPIFAQRSIDALETSRGVGTVTIDGMVFKDDIQNFNPYSLKSRVNEFEILLDGRCIGKTPLEHLSVWATDLIIDRVTFLVSKEYKEECFKHLVNQYGAPDTVLDMYVWKSLSTTLTFRINPQRAAIRKKGQGLGVFWRTKDFEKLLQEVQDSNQ